MKIVTYECDGEIVAEMVVGIIVKSEDRVKPSLQEALEFWAQRVHGLELCRKEPDVEP